VQADKPADEQVQVDEPATPSSPAGGTEIPKWFGNFLKNQRQSRGIAVKGLVERAKDLELLEGLARPNPNMFRRLESGEGKQFNLFREDHLFFLSRVYEIPLPLIYAASSEPMEPFVLLDRDNYRTLLKDPEGEGATYRIANTRLQGTAQSIIYLVLGPGGSSREHYHGVNEIALVVSGEISYELSKTGTTPQSINVKPGQIFHFDSHYTHKVVNKSQTEKAEVVIIRSYPELGTDEG
jgi:quercetin dioxygenase-like cupin family protein